MRVLFFSHQSEFMYGGEICSLSFMRELGKVGVEVHFASPRGPYLDAAKSVAKTHVVSSKQFNRDISQFWKIPRTFWQTHREISELVEREAIDLIHVTSLKAMAYFLFFPKKRPVLWHHHDILPMRFDNNIWLKALASRADQILVPSNASRAELHRIGIAHVKTLYNGFRATEWKSKKPRQSDDPFRIGMVGEISERKGADRWEEIVRELSVKHGNVEFFVIGEGLSDPEFAQSIQNALAKYSVKFLGRRSDMKEQYAQLDAILVLSKQDPLPTVIIEAGFTGVPAIGTKVGGIPELIDHEQTGFLVESDEDVIKSIELLMDVKRWEKISFRAKQKMVSEFSIEQLTKKLKIQYELLLKE